MNSVIRKAKREDCNKMMELIRELALYERAPHEVTVTMNEFEEAGFGTQPIYKAFVAENANEIIGFALYYIRYSTWKGRRMYLEDLLVTKAYRGQGIGQLLFDELIRECKREHLHGIAWQVLDWNEPAIHFYKKYQASFSSEWLNGSLTQEQIDRFEV